MTVTDQDLIATARLLDRIGVPPDAGPEVIATVAAALAAERAAADQRLNAVLRECGIDYPTGLQGVRDLYQLFLGQKARAEEAEAVAAQRRADALAAGGQP